MNDRQHSFMHEEQLQFFGKITASVTHEINNVLSVINENSGLLSDWLVRAAQGHALDYSKVKRVNDTIQNHLGRGKTIVKRLNRFAHSVDEPVKEVDITEAIENITALSQRLAYQKNVSLHGEFPADPVTVVSNPLILQQVVFQSIALLLEKARSSDSIVIHVKSGSPQLCIRVSGPSLVLDESTECEESLLQMLVRDLGGEVETTLTSISIVLPQHLPGRGKKVQ